MSPKQRKHYLVLAVMWIGVNIYFWHWWLNPDHIGNPVLYGLMSVALLYVETILPSMYTFYLGHMKRPQAVDVAEAEAAGVVKRVAVVSLTVPGSESLEFVKRQLIAMKEIRYPHDSWILVDKEHSPEIQALAEDLGVFYFSRHDASQWGHERVASWNRPEPPFKAKTKAGNVNSWIDAHGHLYSHFTQLDIDHLPVPSYLDKVLGFFLDSQVKWVQAPSVYGNLETWTARGSAEQEFVLQGPLQMGFYGFCRTPFIIGSHCTYEMNAIREIGGFQPTRAEDHLDTVFLAARGHQGVFLPEVIAVGEGPENFETYVGQQFAWAFSMIQVLFTYTAKCLKRYTPRQALQFLFVQTWYTFWSISMLLLFLLPLIALFTNTSIAQENYWQFLLHISPLAIVAFMIWTWSRRWHLPQNVNPSWRGIVLHVVRWPIVLSALIQVVFKVQKPYMITVKGLQYGAKRPFSLAAHMPYFALMGMALLACWFYLSVYQQSAAQGNLLFALQGALIFLLAYSIALLKDLTDIVKEGISFGLYVVLRVKPIGMLLLYSVLIAWTGCICINHIYQAIMLS
jgi:cellulose synthase (UDP-forming)